MCFYHLYPSLQVSLTRNRWFDMPFTREEALTADKKFTLFGEFLSMEVSLQPHFFLFVITQAILNVCCSLLSNVISILSHWKLSLKNSLRSLCIYKIAFHISSWSVCRSRQRDHGRLHRGVQQDERDVQLVRWTGGGVCQHPNHHPCVKFGLLRSQCWQRAHLTPSGAHDILGQDSFILPGDNGWCCQLGFPTRGELTKDKIICIWISACTGRKRKWKIFSNICLVHCCLIFHSCFWLIAIFF